MSVGAEMLGICIQMFGWKSVIGDVPKCWWPGDAQQFIHQIFIEGSLEVKLPTIWTDEKQSREEAERRERLEERRVEEKE